MLVRCDVKTRYENRATVWYLWKVLSQSSFIQTCRFETTELIYFERGRCDAEVTDVGRAIELRASLNASSEIGRAHV